MIDGVGAATLEAFALLGRGDPAIWGIVWVSVKTSLLALALWNA